MAGKAKNSVERFTPKYDMKNPDRMVLRIAPAFKIEPSQDTCKLLNGPDISGVSSETSCGNAGIIK